MDFREQIERIKEKLKHAKRADKKYKVFGADSHKYFIGKPASEIQVQEFEKEYGITLPECYRAFLTQIGNGGKSYAKSAAGPSYGIYPLGSRVDEILEQPLPYLKLPAQISPQMSEGDWKALCGPIDLDDEISDEDYDKEMGRIYSGVLPIGSQGCTYLQAIIVNGEYKGKVVNIDLEMHKPHFTFESNFLDWYERWLDEIVCEDLLQNGPTWFGYSMGGTDEKLLEKFNSSSDIEIKTQCLDGLLKKAHISTDVLDSIIKEISNKNESISSKALQIVTKSDYSRAKNELKARVESSPLQVFQNILWYAKPFSQEWLPNLKTVLASHDTDIETYRFATYLAVECKSDLSELVRPNLDHSDSKMREHAKYALEEFKDMHSEIQGTSFFSKIKSWFK